MTNFSKSLAVGAGALAAALGLCFVILAWNEPGSPPPAGNVAAPINTGATAQTKAGDLNLVGKLSVAGDFASGRFCLAGKCCATWEECFGAPTPPPPTCSCTSWINGDCGAFFDGCNFGKRKQTRSCSPSGCDSESQCVADAICFSGGPEYPGCERDSDCSAGYVCYNDACCRLFSAAELNDLCEFEGWQCGTYLNCGQQNVDCGSCAAGSCNPLSHKCCTTCEEMGYECGDFDNGCGSGDCGICPASPVYPFSAKQCVDHKCVN